MVPIATSQIAFGDQKPIEPVQFARSPRGGAGKAVTRILTLSGVALVVTLVAVACSGESKPEPPPASVGSATAVESKPEPPPADSAAAVAPALVSVECLASSAESVANGASDVTTGPTATQRPGPLGGLQAADVRLAPELADITGWCNSEPFTLASLRGKVVLVDFWTYTCINCIRTLPYLKEWHRKYADEGLVIVGVHAYEFEFEKKLGNIAMASEGFGLQYAISVDNERGTWDAYKNNVWPAKYIIGKDGYIRYTHFGEGSYSETEQVIRTLLEEAGADLSMILANTEPDPERDPEARPSDPRLGITRELYAGTDRNYSTLQFGNVPPYVAQSEFYRQRGAQQSYQDPGEHLNHFLYLQGTWLNGPESLRHARSTTDYEDYLAITFYAKSVNVVMSPEGGEPYEVRVWMDGMPLQRGQAGVDIMFDEEGNSSVLVDESRMYHLVQVPEFGGHELKLSSNSPDLLVFAYTFGAFKEPARVVEATLP